MENSDTNTDLARRKAEILREYTKFFEDDSKPNSKTNKLQLDALENLLKGFKDPNMNDTYLEETNNFLSHPWSKMDTSLSHVLDWNRRSALLQSIETSLRDKFGDVLDIELFTPRVWASFVSATIEELQEYLSAVQSYTSPDLTYVGFKLGMRQVDSSLPDLLKYGSTKKGITRKKPPVVQLYVFNSFKSKLHKNSQAEFQWKPSLVQDLSEIFEEASPGFDSDLETFMVSSNTQRIIRNGYQFEIKAEDPEDPKFAPSWEIYELMWKLSLMGAILGAGEVPDQTIPEPEQDPDGQLAPTSQELDTEEVIKAVIDRLEDIVNQASTSTPDIYDTQSDGAKEDGAG
ncbi:Integral membrane protein [Colletotrichum sp. SAR 10_70]|nr:Integral membrane protein [Colletotrichum sp. SAR 10_71]KAI8183643.1 Integral membrane protein [Colletotrichum sp. SAR 10_75]KAI8201087.1 Integral membrane protein [Colletotrichum sp. SAR 10_70]KAI8229865.1 Integral membrane protein [Colletotrichum sp. SAR 10_86]KAI8250888.1 Integral membrane protein [Colletotrichum sp. SAR 10_77]KAJ5003535.1 Integral membrane protein [Colletotrichum sp. SAR 10_66]